MSIFQWWKFVPIGKVNPASSFCSRETVSRGQNRPFISPLHIKYKRLKNSRQPVNVFNSEFDYYWIENINFFKCVQGNGHLFRILFT